MQSRVLFREFVAEINDLNLRRKLTEYEAKFVTSRIDEYGVLVFKKQFLSDPQLIKLGRAMGPLEKPLARDQYGGVAPEVTRLSNVGSKSELLGATSKHAIFMSGNLLWHSDSSFKKVPSKYSILLALETPSVGGGTQFVDTRDCYDRWNSSRHGVTRRELKTLTCEHSIVYSRGLISGDIFSDKEKRDFCPQSHPLVRVHPETKRYSFFIGSHCSHINGWELKRGRALIKKITALCTAQRYIYTHLWQRGDVVIWDNRTVLHRGLPFDFSQRRVMHRVTVSGEA